MTKRKLRETYVIHVVLDAPRAAADFVIYARLVHDKMAENAVTFPAPEPPLTALQAAIDEVRADAAGATIKGIGGADDRNASHTRLTAAMNSERAYVERVAAADPKNAAVIAGRAAMRLKNVPLRDKPPLELRRGPVQGSVVAIAKAVAKAMLYYWQYSLDGGITWIDLPMTSGAQTTLENLTPKTTVHVRFHAFLRNTGHADWCDPAEIVVP